MYLYGSPCYRYVTWSAVLVWGGVLCALWRGNVRVLATDHHLCCGAVVLCWSDNSKLVLCCGLLWWCSITTVTTLAPRCSMLSVTVVM